MATFHVGCCHVDSQCVLDLVQLSHLLQPALCDLWPVYILTENILQRELLSSQNTLMCALLSAKPPSINIPISPTFFRQYKPLALFSFLRMAFAFTDMIQCQQDIIYSSDPFLLLIATCIAHTPTPNIPSANFNRTFLSLMLL